MTGGGDPSSGKHEAFRARGERPVGPATIFGPGVVGFDPTLGSLGTSMLPMPPSHHASLGRVTEDTLSGSGVSQVCCYQSARFPHASAGQRSKFTEQAEVATRTLGHLDLVKTHIAAIPQGAYNKHGTVWGKEGEASKRVKEALDQVTRHTAAISKALVTGQPNC